MRNSPAGLDQEAIDYLREKAEELSFGDGDIIVRRGDSGEAFYVVLEGRVEVHLSADTDCRLPLVCLEKGAFFGELSVLTGEIVSADVVAIGGAKILRYPGKDFPTALSECAPLRARIMTGMAANLQRTTTDAWNFFQRAEALNVLMDTSRLEGPVIAESSAMGKITKEIEALPHGSEPVLVTGETGTGRTFVAAKIHESILKAAPFIVIDCRSISDEEAVPFLFGSSWFRRDDCRSTRFGSLQNYGALHLANGGTMVLRHIEDLSSDCQSVLAGYITGLQKGEVSYPATRVVATAGKGAEVPGGEGLTEDLQSALADHVIAVPALRERRKDIIPLAEYFLAKYRRREGQTFTLSAEHTLISRRYTHLNVAELEEAVELAALFADGRLIEAEHIFTGPKDQGSELEFDLQQIPLVRTATSRPFLAGARSLFFASFVLVIAFCLFFGRTAAGQTANAVVWALWEPALFALFFFVGRVWCTICPISTAGRIATRVKCFNRPPEDWMKKHSGWLVAAGFLTIIWSEHAFGMTGNPVAASMLLLSLMSGAVILSIIYRRETWCRYICPLGNLGAAYASSAMLTVRANPNVCATFCKTHECYKGSGDLPGCPVFHHPLYARDAHNCKNCCTCLWTCPHNSARLYLRLPLQSIWRQADLGGELVPFAVFLFFFAPFMLASQSSAWTASTGGFTFNALLALFLTVVFLKALPRIISSDSRAGQALHPRISLALLVLAWGPAMAYQLHNIRSLMSLRIHAEEGTLLASLLPRGEISVQLVLQLGVILIAAFAASICLWGIRSRASHDDMPASPRGWQVLAGLCVAYIVASIALVLPRGIFF